MFWLLSHSVLQNNPFFAFLWLRMCTTLAYECPAQGGGSTYGPNRHQPPFWQINHATSAYLRLFLGYFQVISANQPPFWILAPPPLFTYPGSAPGPTPGFVGSGSSDFKQARMLKKSFWKYDLDNFPRLEPIRSTGTFPQNNQVYKQTYKQMATACPKLK